MAWSLFGDFSWTIKPPVFLRPGDHLFFTDSPSSGMDGFGRATQKVVYQVGNLFGDQVLHRALGWHLAHRLRIQTIMSIAVLKQEKAEATVYLDPNISQTSVKFIVMLLRLGTNRRLYLKLVTTEKRLMWS